MAGPGHGRGLTAGPGWLHPRAGEGIKAGPGWLHPGLGGGLRAGPGCSYLVPGLDSTGKFLLGPGPWQWPLTRVM